MTSILNLVFSYKSNKYITTATQIKMKPINLYVSKGSLYKNNPNIN